MKLYQIHISREEARRINAGERLPKYEAHLKASFPIQGEFPGREFYEHVAELGTEDLDKAFEIGNIGPEESIVRHLEMHSVSVGDVLVNAAGEAFIVASFGFNKLEESQWRS